MASFLIFVAIVCGICLIWFAVVLGIRKPDPPEMKGVARLGKALSKTKDDPIEPARFVP